MSTFVLLPGAGGAAWYWHLVTPLLQRAGHEVIAVDLPGDDKSAGLTAYADRVVEAVGDRRDVTVVAQSMGGFTAALVATRIPLTCLVFVNAMIPNPGETAGAYWGNTGTKAAQREAAIRGGYSPEFDLETYFLHDVPKDVAAEGEKHERDEAPIAFGEAAAFEAWPAIPIHVIAGKDDRFFPIEFQTRIAKERLGLGVDAIPGGHLVSLSHPRELAEKLLSYVSRAARRP